MRNIKKTPLDIRGKEKLSLKQLKKESAEFEKKLIEKLKKGGVIHVNENTKQ